MRSPRQPLSANHAPLCALFTFLPGQRGYLRVRVPAFPVASPCRFSFCIRLVNLRIFCIFAFRDRDDALIFFDGAYDERVRSACAYDWTASSPTFDATRTATATATAAGTVTATNGKYNIVDRPRRHGPRQRALECPSPKRGMFSVSFFFFFEAHLRLRLHPRLPFLFC